jgi:hypothetical protein
MYSTILGVRQIVHIFFNANYAYKIAKKNEQIGLFYMYNSMSFS